MGNGSYWDGAEWSTVQVDSPFDKAKVFVQATAPVDPTPMRTGDLFIDTDTRKVQFRNGTSWTDISAGLEIINISDVVGLSGALDLKAPLASPTFTGTVSGITKAMVGLGNVDNTSDASKPVSTAQQTALNLKANLASPTFTGTVGGITKSMVGLANVDNTTDLSKPISTATQNALNLKSDTAHNHSVVALSDWPAAVSLTELGYLDGVTSAIQTQLDGKQASGSYAEASHAHAGTDITSGTVPAARLPAATTAVQGAAILATAAEVITGTDATKAVTPAAVNGSIVTGGLPTDANGSYVRFPDGTQICLWESSMTPTANTNTGKTWTFAAAFLTGSQPVVSVIANTTAETVDGMYFSSATTTSVVCRIVRSNDASTQFHAIAIGRWK